ncbi:MAG TPA: MFS transporter [Gammaproteobacteria bacterium]|jgi:EmrB/QacA subfamily drug resistance transporter
MPRQTESKHARIWVLITAILGSSLVFLEGSVVGLALPSMQSDLQAPSLQLQWVVNAYMLMLGAFMLIGGSLGDRFGMRRVFILGSLIFCVGATACGFAPNLTLLLTARVVQGAGGALLVPACLALISLHYAGAARGRAIGIWAGASALTTSAGPLLGGWLVDAFGRHSVFLLLAPWALVGLGLAWWKVPKDGSTTSAADLDYAGAALLAACLGAGIYSLSGSGGTRWALAAASLICGAGFFWREAKAKAPMLPLKLFRSWPFSGANLMTLLLYAAMSGGVYFLPFDFMQVQGYTALQAGMAFLPFAVILGLGSVFAASLIRRFDPRWVLSLGPCVTAVGFLLLMLPGRDASYFTGFLPGIVVMGIGMTVSVTPLTTVVMQSLDAHHAGIASGVNNTASRLAGVLAVAGMTALAVGLFAPALAHELQSAGIPQALAAQLQAGAGRLAELAPPADTSPVLKQAVHDAIGLAYVRTFRWIMLACALLAAAGGVVAWLSLGQHPGRHRR